VSCQSASVWSLFVSTREHRRKRDVLLNYLRRRSAAIRVEKVLAMLVESGFVYCCIWARHLFSIFFSETHLLGGGHTGALFNIHIPGITRSLVPRIERLSCIFLGS
jgi:hypothetical protein